ncbi:MAG: GNAT family N-acetyltransferase [Candidatus Heimdallarchaeota archaeon]
MTIKRLSKEHEPILRDLWDYCFGGGERTSDEDWNAYYSQLDLDNCLGYFVDNELASTYVIQHFKMFVRGNLLKMGGIAAVATYPQYRKQKQITALLIESLKVMRKNKEFISVLYPFKYSFYRRYGYENCADFGWTIASPSNILLPKDFKPLSLKEISHDESFDIVMPFRKKIGKEKYNLVLFDTPEAWKSHNLKKHSKLFVIQDGDETVGYFITNLKKMPGEWNVRLEFRDALVDTMQARLTVFDYIKKHADQNKDFDFKFMGDENPLDYFDNLWYDGVKYQISGGPMFRLVDIEKTFELLGFDEKLTADFSIQVEDEYAPWNSDRMVISISQGKATVIRKDAKDIDILTDIKAFTQLFTGYRSIDELIELGKVEITSDKIGLIREILPKVPTRLRTFF